MTSDRFAEDEVAGVLVERPGTREFSLLQAARVAAAQTMLRRSGFESILVGGRGRCTDCEEVSTSLVAASRMAGGTMNRKSEEQEPEATECHCGTVPLSHLGLDIAEPMNGWPAFFRERGNRGRAGSELGRPSVPRQVLGELLNEREEQEARTAVLRGRSWRLGGSPIPAGVPALEGATAFQSMAAAGIVTVAEEVPTDRSRTSSTRRSPQDASTTPTSGRRPELLDAAQRVLDGRDPR